MQKRNGCSYFPDVDEKAQASAPFELFVAVIIMTFVVIVGYQMLQTVNNEVCLNTVDREMTKLKINLEDTVARKSSNRFMFQPDNKCFSSKDTMMKLALESNKDVCAARCGHPSENCFILTFYNPNVPNGFKAKCMDVPIYTSFVKDDASVLCGDAEPGFVLTDPTIDGSIQIGSYILRNVSTVGETFPKVCMWYKAGG